MKNLKQMLLLRGLLGLASVMAVPGLDPGIDAAIHENTGASM
jgi:hypothetical protein